MPAKDHHISPCIQKITTLLNAHSPYIWVTTYEENRFLQDLYINSTQMFNKELWTWSSYQGLIKYEKLETQFKASGDMESTPKVASALEAISKYKNPQGTKSSVWVMRDFHTVLSQPIPRILRDIRPILVDTNKTIIILSPALAHGPSGTKPGIEPTLEKEISVVDYDLPTREFIDKQLRECISDLKDSHPDTELHLDYEDGQYNSFAMALQGLTQVEAESAMTTCICENKGLDERILLEEKKQVIKRSDVLEYIDQAPDMSEVGGLDLAKEYFNVYKDQFSIEAQEFGVEPLKGVLLVGVPGAGKSLISKAISACWSLPLLRFDVGKVMSGLVGSSEAKMRETLKAASSVAPCICWLDEIEKSLSGTGSSNRSDGGTLARVFGTLLTAMEEGMEGVVFIATSNDITAMPPELIRRFNEVMFVDLPTDCEREEIFRIHMKKRGRNPDELEINMDELVKATNKFTGSEIEKAVTESIARAFKLRKKDINQEDLLGAVQDTKPISTVMGDKIEALRDWARNKARYASSYAQAAAAPGAQTATTSRGKKIEFNDILDDMDEVKKPKKKKKSKVAKAVLDN